MAKQMYGPIADQKYPGLTSDEVKKLEAYADMSGLTGMLKLQYTTKLYQQYSTFKDQEERKEERAMAENQLHYQSLKTNDKKQATTTKNSIRMEQLVDLVKDKYHLDAKAPTQGVFNQIVKMAEDRGVSEDYINKYLNEGDETFLVKMGFKSAAEVVKEQEMETKGFWDKAKQVGKNIVGGAYDSVTGLPELGARGIANAVGWTAKKLGANEEKVDELVQGYKDSLKDFSGANIGADEDSFSYGATNVAGDLLQLATGEGAIKLGAKGVAKSVPFLEKLAKLGKTTDDLVREAPMIGKLVSFGTKKGIEGAADTILYNAINGEGTTTEQMGEGAAINTALGVAGKLVPSKKTLESFAKKLEVGGLVNAKTLEAVNNELVQAGVNTFDDVKSAGNWMLERGVKGGRSEIIEQLANHAETFSKAKEELLNLSNTEIKSEAANKTVKFLEDLYDGTLGNEKVIEGLKALENKETRTAKELYQLEKKFDEVTNLFDAKSELKGGATAEGLGNLRHELKTEIEDIIAKDGLGDMKAINNEIQVAKTIEKGANGKLYTEEAKDNIIKGVTHAIGVAAEALGVPSVLRSLANTITKFTGMEKTSLEQLLRKNGKLDDDFLRSVVPESKWQAFRNAVDDLIGNANKNTSIARTDTVVPKETKEFTKSKKSSGGKDLSGLEGLIRQFLLTQTEEEFNDD